MAESAGLPRLTLLASLLLVVLGGCSQPSDSDAVDSAAPDPSQTPSDATEAVLASWPSGIPQPVISGNIPVEVKLPANAPDDPEQLRPFFDSFSWQSFIALNWPVSDQRGVADRPDDPEAFRKAPNGTQTVWGSYKEAFELFGQGEDRPTPWESSEVPVDPCGDGYGPKVLLQANKGSNLLSGLNEAFSFPLIDQALNYAYTEVRFDRAQYDFIRGTDDDKKSWLYRIVNLANEQPITMPASKPPGTLGALMLKATWKVLAADEGSRYYAFESLLYNPDTKKCEPTKMGLVGLHIVQKTETFPEWVWSSFEQVDNVEAGPGLPTGKKPSFNNGTNTPQTTGGWADRPPAKVPPLQPRDMRKAVQVTRFNPIPDTPPGASTQDVNRAYQKLLADTVWKYYQLIITQWPTQPQDFKTMEQGGFYPEDAGQPFPVDGCTNTVMETFFQSPSDAAGSGGNSCMSCHYEAARSDFSWVLQLRAY